MKLTIALIIVAAHAPLALAQNAASPANAPQVFAPGVISGPASDLSPAFTPDGRTVFFTRANPRQSSIMVSHFVSGHWTRPEVAPFSGEWSDLEATMAPDGSYLVFVSARPATPGGKALVGAYNKSTFPGRGGNLWRVDHTASGWSAARRLPDVINSNSSVFSPSIAGDGSLYFMQPVDTTGKFHLFRAQFANGKYETPLQLSFSLLPNYGDFDPAVARDESFVIFSSGRPPAKTTSLFISYRRNGSWSDPERMSDEVNGTGSNIEARLSPDGRTLYFSSDRVGPRMDPQTREQTLQGLERMQSWENGGVNIWYVPLLPWLAK